MPGVRMVIKSAIPVGYSDSVRDKYGIGNVIVPPGFLRGSKEVHSPDGIPQTGRSQIVFWKNGFVFRNSLLKYRPLLWVYLHINLAKYMQIMLGYLHINDLKYMQIGGWV